MSDLELEPPDLTRRFRMEICFPDPNEPDSWETINSFDTPLEALRGCSECVEVVKDLLGTPLGQNLENDFLWIQIRDTEDDSLVLWEDENGALQAKEAFWANLRPC